MLILGTKKDDFLEGQFAYPGTKKEASWRASLLISGTKKEDFLEGKFA